MQLPLFKALNTSDYDKQYEALINTLSNSLNSGIQNLYTALAGQLSLGDNLLESVKTFSVQVDSSNKLVNLVTFTLSNTNQTTLQGLSVIQVVNKTNPTTYPTSGVTISYTQTQTGIQINHVTGLTPTDTWTITVIAWG